MTRLSDQIDAQISDEEIRNQTERILASSSFKNSKRHTRFLRYIVEKTLSGESEGIKERSIGIEVFDRPADYDVSNDAIVRVAAGEIRKRLAQYYLHEGASDEIALDLPSGSYVPLLTKNHPASWSKPLKEMPPGVSELPISESALSMQIASGRPAASEIQLLDKETVGSSRRFGSSRSFRLLLGGFLLVIGGFLAYLFRPIPPLERFWKPVLRPHLPSLVCIGDMNFIMPPDNNPIISEPVSDVMRSRNHVGPNDLSALARLTGILGRYGEPSRVLLADNANLTDLRIQPVVFIGAFDNVWTQRIASDSPIRLRRDPITGSGSIVDMQNSKTLEWTVDLRQPLGAVHRDYALVARFDSPLTGQTDVILAGVGPYGTAAASEFVTNPEYFRQFEAQAPKGWEHKDVEIVLSTDVVDGRSAPPRMILFDVR